jgi:RHS repeat-associated protein
MVNCINNLVLQLCLRSLRQAIQQHIATCIYDGWNLISQSQISNLPSQIQTNQTWFVWGLDLSGSLQYDNATGLLTNKLYADGNGPNLFYSYDANGNVTDLVDTNGTTAAHYQYDPYGNTTAQWSDPSATSQFPFRFSTKYLDTETALYYYGYRYYSPELGRWLNRDPIREQGGMNVYAFVGNSPVYMVDIGGMKAIKVSIPKPDHQCDIIGEVKTVKLLGPCKRTCSKTGICFCFDKSGEGYRNAEYVCTKKFLSRQWEFHKFIGPGWGCDAKPCGKGCTDDGIKYWEHTKVLLAGF